MGDFKSVKSDHIVSVKFVNKSERMVALYWVDFKGELVIYSQNFPAGDEMFMSTFVTHPWMARDTETGHWLRLNDKSVYVTPMPDGPQRDEEADDQEVADPIHVGSLDVIIHIPVFRLQDIVIGYLRKQRKDSTLTEEHLTRCLLDQLSNVPKISARLYQPVTHTD